MKKYRTMVTLLAIFVVLIGLYFFLKHTNKVQSENEQDETIMLTQISDLTSMEYTDGEITFSFVKDDDVWKLSDNSETSLDNDAIEAIADAFCQIEAVRVLEGADELSSYGLEDPTYTITLKAESGTEITLYIGDATGENYYATVGDKKVIYVIDSSAVDAMEFDIATLDAKVETEEETVEDITAEYKKG